MLLSLLPRGQGGRVKVLRDKLKNRKRRKKSFSPSGCCWWWWRWRWWESKSFSNSRMLQYSDVKNVINYPEKCLEYLRGFFFKRQLIPKKEWNCLRNCRIFGYPSFGKSRPHMNSSWWWWEGGEGVALAAAQWRKCTLFCVPSAPSSPQCCTSSSSHSFLQTHLVISHMLGEKSERKRRQFVQGWRKERASFRFRARISPWWKGQWKKGGREIFLFRFFHL